MLKVKSLSVLLWLWYPLAVGSIDVVSIVGFLGVSLQQVMLLICYSFAIVIWVAAVDKNKVSVYVVCWLFLVAISVFFSGVNVNKVMQLFALCGAVAWSLLLVRMYSLRDFVLRIDRVSAVFAVLSIFYILLFPSQAIGYVNHSLAFDSFYDQKNTYGRFLFLGCFFHILSSWWRFGVGIYRRIGFWFWLGIYVYLLYLSESKSSMVLLVISCFVMLGVWFGNGSNKFKSLSVASVFLVLGLLVGLYLYGSLRFEGVGSALDCLVVFDSWCVPGTGRYTIWHSVVGDVYASGRQFFGYGYGVYFAELADFNLANIGLGEFIPNDPHNGFVDIFAAFGYVGVAGFMFVLWRAAWGVRDLNSEEFSFFFVFLLVYVISNFTESYFIKSTNIYPVLFFYLLNYIASGRSSACRGGVLAKRSRC